MTLAQAIKKYPNGMIYYYGSDNQSWEFYKRTFTDRQLNEMDEEELDKFVVYIDRLILAEEGYAPAIVVQLAKMLGIKVKSI